ncbi:MAG TPA: VOC family protein [Symbiobacteriaceae bacterium]|jgi:catechol 2,3-dioxygenase
MKLLPESAGIGHVELRVAGRERSLAFYRDLLGFRVISDDGACVRLSATGAEPARLVLRADPQFRPRPRRTAGLYHVAILLPARRDLAAVAQRLAKAAYPLHGAADHLVSEALYLPDPDGNGIELYADRPRADWNWPGGQVAMSTERLDLRALMAEAGDAGAVGATLPPETRVGHVHLAVGGLDPAEAFYHQALGLAITQQEFPGALFLAAPGYHHHVAANVWESRGGSPAPPDSVGLEVFSLEVPSADDLVPIAEALAAGGWPVRTVRGGLESTDGDGNRVQVLAIQP